MRSGHWDEMIRTSLEEVEINVLGNMERVGPETSVSGGRL